MFSAASVVTRSISSNPFFTRSTTAVNRPAPHPGRILPSVLEISLATRLNRGSENLSKCSCVTGRNSIRAASSLTNRFPVSLSRKRLRL